MMSLFLIRMYPRNTLDYIRAVVWKQRNWTISGRMD